MNQHDEKSLYYSGIIYIYTYIYIYIYIYIIYFQKLFTVSSTSLDFDSIILCNIYYF